MNTRLLQAFRTARSASVCIARGGGWRKSFATLVSSNWTSHRFPRGNNLLRCNTYGTGTSNGVGVRSVRPQVASQDSREHPTAMRTVPPVRLELRAMATASANPSGAEDAAPGEAMTIPELIERMPKDGWRLTPNGMIRRGVRCPITSLVSEEDRKVRGAAAVARDLGMTKRDASDVMYASDFPSRHLTFLGYFGLENVVALRHRLLEACGLKEAE